MIYYPDSECFEYYDEKNKRYFFFNVGPIDEAEDYDPEEIDHEEKACIRLDPETYFLTYYLAGWEMYNDGEPVESVKLSMHTLNRYLKALEGN